jgi:hypothetical protein
VSRRLKTIARWINENVPTLRATVVRDLVDTSRKIGRLRWPGKNRSGNRIIVRRRSDDCIVLDHSAAETYRHNEEVERWLANWIAGNCTSGCFGETHLPECRKHKEGNP